MKKHLVAMLCLCALSSMPAFAQGNSKHLFKDLGHDTNNGIGFASPGGFGPLRDHGGLVLTNAKVVFIFWGWASTTADPYVSEVISFRNDPNAMMKHIGMLSQYRNTGSTSLLGSQPDVYDAVPPSSTKVTDSMVQAEVAAKCPGLPNGGCRTDTIYEVLIPSGYYSDDGSGNQSCGGTNLQYCAYHSHGNGTTLSSSVLYSIQPYPSCSGCHGKSNWTAYNDQEHFIVHETREAMSDSLGNAWYDWFGYEADDKCAWGGSTLDFLFDETVNGHTYAYQMEYSNAVRNCVK